MAFFAFMKKLSLSKLKVYTLRAIISYTLIKLKEESQAC